MKLGDQWQLVQALHAYSFRTRRKNKENGRRAIKLPFFFAALPVDMGNAIPARCSCNKTQTCRRPLNMTYDLAKSNNRPTCSTFDRHAFRTVTCRIYVISSSSGMYTISAGSLSVIHLNNRETALKVFLIYGNSKRLSIRISRLFLGLTECPGFRSHSGRVNLCTNRY